MAVSKEDLITIAKFVRDNQAHLPPRPIKAHTIGTLTSDTVNVGAVSIGGVAQPKVTTRALSLGPPPNPQDGDIWIATGVDSSGSRWQFQYDANWTTDAYRWKFIGGPAWSVSGTISMSWTLSAWTAFAGRSYTAVRGGIYQAGGGYSTTGSSSGDATEQVGISVGGAAPSNPFGTVNSSASYWFTVVTPPQDYTVSANSTLALAYLVNGTPANPSATINITPKRII